MGATGVGWNKWIVERGGRRWLRKGIRKEKVEVRVRKEVEQTRRRREEGGRRRKGRSVVWRVWKSKDVERNSGIRN